MLGHVQRELLLSGVTQPRLLDDFDRVLGEELARTVGAAGVEHDDFVSPKHTFDARADGVFAVECGEAYRQFLHNSESFLSGHSICSRHAGAFLRLLLRMGTNQIPDFDHVMLAPAGSQLFLHPPVRLVGALALPSRTNDCKQE